MDNYEILTDDEWALIEPFIAANIKELQFKRDRRSSLRAVVNCIFQAAQLGKTITSVKHNDIPYPSHPVRFKYAKRFAPFLVEMAALIGGTRPDLKTTLQNFNISIRSPSAAKDARTISAHAFNSRSVALPWW